VQRYRGERGGRKIRIQGILPSLWATPLSITAIAKRLGVTYAYIHKMAQELRLPSRKRAHRAPPTPC
jgi:hypothetical protein